MAAMRPDGTSVELPTGRKARGGMLRPANRRRMRDLIAVLLVRGVGLSKPDALAVLEDGTISERHLRRVIARSPASIKDLFSQLRDAAADAKTEGLG